MIAVCFSHSRGIFLSEVHGMKTVSMCLYPHYTTLAMAENYSPNLFECLERLQVHIIQKHWYGDIRNGVLLGHNLPKDEPFIVRSSSEIHCNIGELAQWAHTGGHLVYYNDFYLLPNGNWADAVELVKATIRFVKKLPESK